MQEQMLAPRTTTRKSAPARTTDPVVRLTTAFAELDEEHRIVLCLHYMEGLSLEEIAVVLDDTVESVREVYSEAVTRLGSKGTRKRRRKKAA